MAHSHTLNCSWMKELEQQTHLSAEEITLLQDAGILPLKRRICDKMESWLSDLGTALETLVDNKNEGIFTEVWASSPRITRGDNYRGQAYRVLDYPRFIQGEDLFLFRTVLLWGHPIGVHLILAGKFKDICQGKWGGNLPRLFEGSFLSVQETPWIWESDAPGLVSMEDLTEEGCLQLLVERSFLKVSHFMPLEDYADLVSRVCGIWSSWQNTLR